MSGSHSNEGELSEKLVATRFPCTIGALTFVRKSTLLVNHAQCKV
jgi:hypothetical protein